MTRTPNAHLPVLLLGADMRQKNKVPIWFQSFYKKYITEHWLPFWLSGKESACQCRRCGFDPWVRKIARRRKQQPTPVFLLGKSYGQRSLAGYDPWSHKRVRQDIAAKKNNNNKNTSNIFLKNPFSTRCKERTLRTTIMMGSHSHLIFSKPDLFHFG